MLSFPTGVLRSWPKLYDFIGDFQFLKVVNFSDNFF